MPWYLAALIVAGRRGGAWWVAPPMAMGLLLLAGDPQIALLTAGAGVVFALIERRALLVAILSPTAGRFKKDFLMTI